MSIPIYKSTIDTTRLSDRVVVLDAGASHGDFWLPCIASLAPRHVDIVAIECNRTNLAHLTARCRQALLPVVVLPYALVGDNHGDECVFTEFVGQDDRYHEWGNICSINKQTASVRRDFLRFDEYPVKTVKINSLFSLLEGIGVSHIDFIKMDIEGSEVDVLKTMSEETARRITQIAVEPHNSTDVILNEARRLGYDVVDNTVNNILLVRNRQ